MTSRRDALAALDAVVIECRLCPRLVSWREEVAIEKRASFADQEYWGRPITGFGDPDAKLLIVGLAPAAHGGNRTGRVFTGDRSGEWLFGSLFRTGWANQPMSLHVNDGLTLHGAYITAAVRCAPPANKPTPEERDTCLPYMERELAILDDVAVIVALGSFAWDAVLRLQEPKVRPKPRFGHLVETLLPNGATLLGSFHPSQQNTFTGKLTEEMLDAVFLRARDLTS